MTDVLAQLRVDGEPVACRQGQVLLEALQLAGLLVQSACSGRALCGLCQVRVTAGQASVPTVLERRILPDAGAPAQPRLACQMRLVASVDIDLPKLGSSRGKNLPP